MTMKRARRLRKKEAAAGTSFRPWVKDVWKKFGELGGESNVSGKLARILGIGQAHKSTPKRK